VVIRGILASALLAAALSGCGWLQEVWRDPPVVVRGAYGSSSGLQGEVGIKF